MNAKLSGVLQSFKMLQHDVETDAEEMAQRIMSADARRKALKTATDTAVDALHSGMQEIEDFLGAMEGNNGAPGNASADSSTTSQQRSSDLTQK